MIVHQLSIAFSSTKPIDIRVTVNQVVSNFVCDVNTTFKFPIDPLVPNCIQIETLTPDVACNIDRVGLNSLDLEPVLHIITRTYAKQDRSLLGQFVRDIYSPDLAVIDMTDNFYQFIYPFFKKDDIKLVPPV